MKKCFIFFFFFFLLSGCLEEKILDDINIMSAFGYDAHEEGKIEGTGIIPVYKADKSISNETFTAVGEQTKIINRLIQQTSADPLENGSIEVILFGKKMSERGVMDVIDTLERDARIGSNITMAVVDGTAKDVLEQHLGNRGTGNYLSTLIQHNMERRELPQTNLHLFLNSYYSKVKDPFLPYIELHDDKVRVKGIALFKEDKVVSFVDDSDMFFVKALMENFENGSHTFKVEGEYVSTFSLNLGREYKVKNALTDPIVELKVNMEGLIREYSGEMLDPKMIKKVEKRFEEIINEKCEQLLYRFRDENIDPVGIGWLAKTQTRKFDEKKWLDAYPKATFKVSSEVIITETGVVE